MKPLGCLVVYVRDCPAAPVDGVSRPVDFGVGCLLGVGPSCPGDVPLYNRVKLSGQPPRRTGARGLTSIGQRGNCNLRPISACTAARLFCRPFRRHRVQTVPNCAPPGLDECSEQTKGANGPKTRRWRRGRTRTVGPAVSLPSISGSYRWTTCFRLCAAVARVGVVTLWWLRTHRRALTWVSASVPRSPPSPVVASWWVVVGAPRVCAPSASRLRFQSGRWALSSLGPFVLAPSSAPRLRRRLALASCPLGWLPWRCRGRVSHRFLTWSRRSFRGFA